ncbi:Nitrilase [Pleurostoma richardsiae]|uniref:Nitrilase n=1 Tax=Pleurostoma richardsiae TaxID=41990 RepID=A0AA38RC22_9PEZI|nr:Nitrilase [Pleurostoma richardsiae]
MAPVYKFALIQLQPKPVAPAENFAKAESYIRQAAAQGCHLAVLPEYHLTSWAPEHPDFLASLSSCGDYLPKYQALARELNINIVPGTICEAHPASAGNSSNSSSPDGQQKAAPDEIRNMAYFLAAGTGEVCGAYQKKNLWHPERPHLTSSGQSPHIAFDTPLGVRAGLLVCWDLAFPEAFRELVADGAQLIVVPSFWHLTDVDPRGRALNPDCERLFLESALAARAFENTCAVAFCNSGGVSQVAMPILGALGKVGMEEERMSVVEVDFDVLRIAEENYRVREDMQREGWHYGHTLSRGTGKS